MKNADYFHKVYREALELCAYLCKMFDIPTTGIIGHYEGYRMGLARNHADPQHWFKRYGKSMDIFRSEVQGIIEGITDDAIIENPVEVPEPKPDLIDTYTVNLTIKKQENADFFGKPIGTTVSLPLEEYLLGVVPAEVGNAHPEACKAQAIAARSLLFRWIKGGSAVTDTTSHQSYRGTRSTDSRYRNAHQAVLDTRGIVLTYDGEIASTFYADSNGGQMVACHEHWSEKIPYLVSKPDPWTLASGKPFNGHPVGMSQQGAIYAANHGVKHSEILSFYYPGTKLAANYGKSETGDKKNQDKNQDKKEETAVDLTGHEVFVNTQKDEGLSLWSTKTKAQRLVRIRKGEVFLVTEDHNPNTNHGWVTGEYNGVKGFADKQYLKDLGEKQESGETELTTEHEEIFADFLEIIDVA